MPDFEHTPGPWDVWANPHKNDHRFMIMNKNIKEVVGTLNTLHSLTKDHRIEPNIRLIKSAPELLDGLIELLKDAMNNFSTNRDPEDYYKEEIELIRVATGKTWEEINGFSAEESCQH